MKLPETQTLLLDQNGPNLHVTLNRPDSRNAMSLTMVRELQAVFDAIEEDSGVRTVVLRGAQGDFSAGGDIKDMGNALAEAASTEHDPFYELNRAFGRLIQQVQHAPQLIVGVLEGAIMGGGFGLACVTDVAIAAADARFALPETSLGLILAQIAPFVVTRIGLTETRRLALLGAKFDGHEARRIGLVHEVSEGASAIEDKLESTLKQARQCAPRANAVTKQLILDVGVTSMEQILDQAARDFSAAVQGDEGAEGTRAFMEKRAPDWAQ